MTDPVYLMDKAATYSDLDKNAMKDGKLQVLPAAFWRQYQQPQITAFCVMHGFYSIPTVELVEWLRERIAGLTALEVGSGNGVLAEALGIRATDSRQQSRAEIKAYYTALRQAPVSYGTNVECFTAKEAVGKYKPDVVLGAWVTHKYNPSEHWREGNRDGLDEVAIVCRADYINIGHTYVHRNKPVLQIPHEVFYPDWLVSRALSPGKNYIAVWGKQ